MQETTLIQTGNGIPAEKESSGLKINLKPTALQDQEVLQNSVRYYEAAQEHPGLDNEKKIVSLVNTIDDQITMLDNRMDIVLEQHEKDFLSAYRKHMIAVQKELTELKNKGTETELQLKQDKKISNFEREINKYKEDCTNIMKFCTLQTKIMQGLNLKQRELRDDEQFLDEEIMEGKIENYNLKVKLAEAHNACKAQTTINGLAQDEIDNLLKQSVENFQYNNSFMNDRTPAATLQMPSIDPINQQSYLNEGKFSLQYSIYADKKTQAETNKLADQSKEQTVSVLGPRHDITIDDKQISPERTQFEVSQVEPTMQPLMEEGAYNESASVHAHTFLREKYVQEAEANAAYVPKYMHKRPKGFPDGHGPIDLQNCQNYTQKLANYLKVSIQNCDNEPQKLAKSVEEFFKENLQRKSNHIYKLQEELLLVQQRNKTKQNEIQLQKQKYDQRQLSKVLVQAFKNSVEAVASEKLARKGTRSEPTFYEKYTDKSSGPPPLTYIDKRKILETFVENDEALGQLLDFISTKSGSVPSPSQQPQVETGIDPTISMTMVDRQGNKIQPQRHFDYLKINSKSSMKANLFSRPLIKKELKDIPYGSSIEVTKTNERNYHTAGQSRIKHEVTGGLTDQKKLPRDEIGSRGDESLGIESSYRFKGRGSDFQNGSPLINNGGMIDEPMSQLTNENARNHYFNDLSKKGFRNLSQLKPVGGSGITTVPSALNNGNFLPQLKKVPYITEENKQKN